MFSYQMQVEKLLKCFFYFYRYTKINATKRLLLVDAKIFKYGPRQIFLFVFFYKMVTKRRNSVTSFSLEKTKLKKYTRKKLYLKVKAKC
jgi:hypothetical protein